MLLNRLDYEIQHVLLGVLNIKIGQIKNGQEYYGVTNQLSLNFNTIGLVKYGMNHLNPIENLWAIVKCNIHKKEKPLTTLKKLDKYVKEAWKAIPKSMIIN
ncbi:hypothetical protein G9A89_002228 [Geosiphon pyriformis]|nr:hypothetical protein G9A89_002228 [Geosiphon pyriformis]